MEKFKSFVPKFVFNTDKKEWERINQERKDYLVETRFREFCESITELCSYVIYVTWKDRETPSIYSGKLEYTDEYELVLNKRLKELSKNFTFRV